MAAGRFRVGLCSSASHCNLQLTIYNLQEYSTIGIMAAAMQQPSPRHGGGSPLPAAGEGKICSPLRRLGEGWGVRVSERVLTFGVDARRQARKKSMLYLVATPIGNLG